MKKIIYLIGVFDICIAIYHMFEKLNGIKPYHIEKFLKACGGSDESVDSFMECFGYHKKENRKDDTVVMGFRAD